MWLRFLCWLLRRWRLRLRLLRRRRRRSARVCGASQEFGRAQFVRTQLVHARDRLPHRRVDLL